MDWRDTSRSFRLAAVGGLDNWLDHNAAGVRGLLAFQAPAVNDTLTQLRIFSGNINGTVTGILTVDVFAFDIATLLPTGSSLATTTGTPVSNGWFNTGSFSLSTTANTWYCAVTRNTDATPATNRFTLTRANGGYGLTVATGIVRSSTDSGSTWSGNQDTTRSGPWGHTSVVPLFTTSGYHSAPAFRGVAVSTAGDLYSNGSSYRGRYGVEYQFTDAVVLQALTWMRCDAAGGATFNVKAEVWSGGSLVATSTNVLRGDAFGPWLFSDVTLNAGQLYQIILTSELDTAGSASVRYQPVPVWTEAHSNGWTVGPYRRGVASTNYSGSPSFSTTSFYAQILQLKPAVASGGSSSGRSAFSGGFNQ